MSKIEEEISREWQAKSDRMLAAAAEKYNRQLTDLKDEKEDLQHKVEELEKKVCCFLAVCWCLYIYRCRSFARQISQTFNRR